MTTKTLPALIDRILSRGVVDILVRDHLASALRSGRKLRVKFGIDPTGSDIHLGHTVVLRKLRQFQEAEHTVILLIGDFTARIGDPSGRSETRKVLTAKEITANAKTYLAQAGTILDLKKTEVRRNSEWYAKDGLETVLRVAQGVTVQQVLKREDFGKRLAAGTDISFLESLYPLLQGYDSVALEADVELGGTDQTFNLLMGRHIQRFYKEPEQDIMTMPLLEGTDGARKMSKSYGNYVAVNDAPSEKLGKLMSIPDALVPKYFELLTDLDYATTANPRDAKLALAHEIVRLRHSAKEADAARDAWIRTFSKGEVPDDATPLVIGKALPLLALLMAAGIESKSEARRLIAAGAVSINETVRKDPTETPQLKGGEVLKVGKHRFWKLKVE